ncbi:hypothetical protein GCM10012275_52950 [Longimycelium tulufanense]|uniref:Uncharacterized protein n=1 Tax=Longimycelium tulufanense TaxID=907463 RepID=A0A8J3CGT8_9PSEU|nr:hypothetical protein [Longimycelium tulufanense]GGM75659.1 hypothetical protein GCM10012275_52950 [Longimycelium tulufanense]
MADAKPGDDHNLERFWKFGRGAARIRWGTEGDFARCVRQLDEHVGSERAKRICAQWHKDMNGFWPGDKRNR